MQSVASYDENRVRAVRLRDPESIHRLTDYYTLASRVNNYSHLDFLLIRGLARDTHVHDN